MATRRRPWIDDIAARRLPRARALERARRGAALARAVLAGDVDPADLGSPPPLAGDQADGDQAPPPVEVSACRVCFRPHEASPGTVCDRCDQQGRG